MLKPFPVLKTCKAFQTKKTIADSKNKNANVKVRYIHNSSASSSESDNHITYSDFPSVSKNQNRNLITEVVKNKKMRKDDTNNDFEEVDKENLHPYISDGTCIFIIIIYFMIISTI